MLQFPVVAFHTSVPVAKRLELAKVVERLEGRIATSLSEATHVVHWFKEVDESKEPDADYLRTLAIRNLTEQALVHWWYYPDSYESWIPLADVEGLVCVHLMLPFRTAP